MPDCVAEEHPTDSWTEERLANVQIWHSGSNETRTLAAPWVGQEDFWITRRLSQGRVLFIEGRASFDEPGANGRPGLSTFLMDTTSGQWSVLGTLNTYYSVDSSFAELSDGTLYAAGADKVFTLAPGTTSWSRSPHRPLSRGPLVRSGPDTATALGSDWRGTAVHLDLRTGRWSRAVNNYYLRRHPALTTLDGGKLLVIGGETESVQSFEARRERWSADAELPMPLAYPEAVPRADGQIMIVGLSSDEQIQCLTSSTAKLAWQKCGTLSARQQRDREIGRAHV